MKCTLHSLLNENIRASIIDIFNLSQAVLDAVMNGKLFHHHSLAAWIFFTLFITLIFLLIKSLQGQTSKNQ